MAITRMRAICEDCKLSKLGVQRCVKKIKHCTPYGEKQNPLPNHTLITMLPKVSAHVVVSV